MMILFCDQVQKIYPDAKCFTYNGSYCIMDIPVEIMRELNLGRVFPRWPSCYSRWSDTEELAWRDAWEKIQQEMLDKFER